MLKRFINKLLRPARQYTFATYKDYVAAQTAANHQKIERVWLTEPEAQVIADLIKTRVPHARRGLCHGSRNGWEVRWFREHLNQDVVGTDISDTAEGFGLVQHDFHEPHGPFMEAFDWVYSNSLDHAYDPSKALSAWLTQIRLGGIVVLHWSPEHDRADHADAGTAGADSFQASRRGYRKLAKACGRLLDVVETGTDQRCLFVIARP